MGRNLTDLYISQSFQYLIQQSGSEFQNGLGTKVTGTVDITSQYANIATIASSATTAVTASYALTAASIGTGLITNNSSSIILPYVSASLNFTNDTTAAAGGVPLGGLYRNGNAIQIRLI